jgi:hypothetical protein
MATNSFVQVPPDSTGKKMFSQEHTIDAQTVQIPGHHLVCGAHPEHIQLVDGRGAAYMRFAEGSPTMDSFGNTRVGEPTMIGTYEYSNGAIDDLFQDISVGAGSISLDPNAPQMIMSCSSANNDSITRTSNRYHFYQPGVGMNVIITAACGDNGKAGNTRRWGYFDESDGLYFELAGTSWNVVRRSSVGGTITEERVGAADWNGDKIDPLTGTIAGTQFQPSMANFFWIDFAWLGVGPVRMGVLLPDGTRWVIHTFQNPNNHISAYMRTGSLPIRYENFNTSATAGTSELKLICAAVYADSKTDYTFWRFADMERTTPVAVTTKTPVISMRVKPGSRVGLYPECLCLFVTGGNVKISIIDDADLTNATWTIDGEENAQGDIGATAATNGSLFKSFYVPAGVTNIPLATLYETNDEGYHRLADDSDSYVMTIVATKLDGTTVTVSATLEYRELR